MRCLFFIGRSFVISSKKRGSVLDFHGHFANSFLPPLVGTSIQTCMRILKHKTWYPIPCQDLGQMLTILWNSIIEDITLPSHNNSSRGFSEAATQKQLHPMVTSEFSRLAFLHSRHRSSIQITTGMESLSLFPEAATPESLSADKVASQAHAAAHPPVLTGVLCSLGLACAGTFSTEVCKQEVLYLTPMSHLLIHFCTHWSQQVYI